MISLCMLMSVFLRGNPLHVEHVSEDNSSFPKKFPWKSVPRKIPSTQCDPLPGKMHFTSSEQTSQENFL